MKEPCRKCKKTVFRSFGESWNICVGCGTLIDLGSPDPVMTCKKGADPVKSHYKGRAISEVAAECLAIVTKAEDAITYWRESGHSWRYCSDKLAGKFGRLSVQRAYEKLKGVQCDL